MDTLRWGTEVSHIVSDQLFPRHLMRRLTRVSSTIARQPDTRSDQHRHILFFKKLGGSLVITNPIHGQSDDGLPREGILRNLACIHNS